MNVKQAAARLGIHYQTAYKLVRSGALVAVRIGGRYDISEAALRQYLAESAAQYSYPTVGSALRCARDRHASISHLPMRVTATVERALAGVTLSAQSVYDTVARSLAEEPGDFCVVRMTRCDGTNLEPVAWHHPDPRASSVVGALVSTRSQRVDDSVHRRTLVEEGGVFLPHVPQDLVRAALKPEYRQYLDEVGVYSLIKYPVLLGDRLVGSVAVARDAPGRPYGVGDRALVAECARLVGIAASRAAAFRRGWSRLGDIVERARGDSGGAGFEFSGAGDDDDLAEVVCEPSGKVIGANRSAEGLAYGPGARALGTDLLDVIVPDERDAERDLIRRLLVGELAYASGLRTVRVAGRDDREVVVHRGVVRAADGRVEAVAFVAHTLIEAETQSDVSAAGWPADSRVGRDDRALRRDRLLASFARPAPTSRAVYL